MADYSIFRAKAPVIMKRLMADFDLNVDQAAAILGNLGHESGGFKFLQEIKPLVPGSKGGWGWAQWTGSRRDAFEKWVADHGYDPSSDEANYGYLKHELETTEAGAIPAVLAARSLNEAVRRFEQTFERAHPDYKHYASRERYATIALEAYRDSNVASGEWSRSRVEVVETVVSFGMQGPLVTAVQEALFKLDYSVGDRDGIFGTLTRAAVLAFQADNNLAVTGTVGDATWEALRAAPPRALARKRTTASAADLLKLGSRTILDGNRTKNLGWLAGILGVLGIGTGAIRSPDGAAVATPAPGLSAQQVIDQLSQVLNAAGSEAVTQVSEAKVHVAQLQEIVSAQGGDAAIAGASPIGQGLEAIVGLAGTILPGVPGGVLAILVGIAAHVLGSGVVQARVRDHRDASNVGR